MAASSPDAKKTQALDTLFGADTDKTWGTSIRLRTRCALARDHRGVLIDDVALHTAVEEDIKSLPPGMRALPLAQVRQLVVHAFSFRNPRTLHTFLQMSPSAKIDNATRLHEYIRRDGLCDPRFTEGALCLMLEALRREYAGALPAEAQYAVAFARAEIDAKHKQNKEEEDRTKANAAVQDNFTDYTSRAKVPPATLTDVEQAQRRVALLAKATQAARQAAFTVRRKAVDADAAFRAAELETKRRREAQKRAQKAVKEARKQAVAEAKAERQRVEAERQRKAEEERKRKAEAEKTAAAAAAEEEKAAREAAAAEARERQRKAEEERKRKAEEKRQRAAAERQRRAAAAAPAAAAGAAAAGTAAAAGKAAAKKKAAKKAPTRKGKGTPRKGKGATRKRNRKPDVRASSGETASARERPPSPALAAEAFRQKNKRPRARFSARFVKKSNSPQGQTTGEAVGQGQKTTRALRAPSPAPGRQDTSDGESDVKTLMAI